MELFGNEAPMAYIQKTHHINVGAVKHLSTSFQQRRTIVVSTVLFLILLIFELLYGYNLITTQLDLLSGILLILPVLMLDVCLVVLVGWLTAEPLAIRAYLRAVQREQLINSRVYTELVAVKNLYETPASPSHQLEQKDIREIAREVQTHLMILGLPGAGKTMALRAAYQFPAFKRYWSLVRGQQSIPVYVPMKDYNAFLGKTNVANNQGITAQNQLVGSLAYPESMLIYLQTDNGLAGLKHLRPYIKRLAERGRLFFLCDGLNEVDRNRLGFVCHELIRTMQGKQCRLAMTCRELDYREEPALRQLVGADDAEVALILPLQRDQIEGFVEQYRKHAPDEIGRQNRYSASEINQRIKQSRLSYNCTNPMMLVTLMKTIDELDNNDLNVGTRGLLLSKYISRLVTAELQRQGGRLITEVDVVLFLSLLACMARRCKLRNAIQLGRAGAAGTTPRTMSIPELAARLQLWLDEHAIPETDVTGQYVQRSQMQRAYTTQDIEQLALFTQGAGLIVISHHGVLSFRHELIAEYFAANYLYMIDVNPQAPIPFGNELVVDIGAWSEPVAMWAGMSQNPMELAKRIANLAQGYPQYSYNALSLSLICAGVRWGPQEKNPQPLPENVSQLLVTAVHDASQRARLAERLKHSADEGGIEVYRALLPLIMEAHIDDLLLMLDKWVVSDLLFDYLRDAVETAMPHEHVKQLVHVLGRFGEVAVPQAVKLSQADPANTVYLRIEALCVLAGTNVLQAVEPLISHLSDSDDQIISATVNALVQLGPTLALDAVLAELKNQVPRALVPGIHWAALAVLRGFLSQHTPNDIQYRRIIGALLQATSSLYIPDIQGEARRLLEGEARHQQGERWQRVVEMMVRSLDDRDEARTTSVQELLQKMGTAATPLLLAELQRSRVEIVKVNIVAVLGTVRDPDALRPLLPLLDDPSPLVHKQVSSALYDYTPESIAPLINMVLYHQNPQVAERASAILKEIGSVSVPRVVDALDRIVRNRTLLLVDVLASAHDARAVRPLMGLLKKLSGEVDVPLTIAVVQALGAFPEKQVVSPLLEVLVSGGSPVFEEASRVLSSFGGIALPELIAALDVQEETASVRRVRAVLLNMQPFCASQLLDALRNCSAAQAQQIEQVFLQKDDTAPFLVSNISHSDQRVRTFVLALLDKMGREQVTPPLLDALKNPGELEVIASFLLKHQESIPHLVNLFSDTRRNDAAATILLRFGTAIVPYLEPGLNHPSAEARLRASTILVRLVQQEREPQVQRKVIAPMVKLFALAQRESHAWYAVLDLLTNQFAEKSIPILLQGLEDAELRDGCAEALVLMVPKHKVILDELLAALRVRERMVGATEALVKLDAKAVEQVNKLILDSDDTVALKAQEILSRIGPTALPFVWANYRNASAEQLQRIARKIFSDMPTERIKDELIRLLLGEDTLGIEMAMTLLSERILVENGRPLPDQKMIAALLAHVQTHGRENTNLRAIALLFLLPKDVVIRHLLPVLHTEHQEWLVQIFLLLGLEGGQVEEVLWSILQSQDPTIPHQLRREVAAVMGFLGLDVGKYATTLNKYSLLLQAQQAGPITRDFQQLQYQREGLEVALRALGGLLAGGKWNSDKLQDLLRKSQEGSPAYELYSVLLGKQFSGQIEQHARHIQHIEQEMRSNQEEHSKQMVSEQARHHKENLRLNNVILKQSNDINQLIQQNMLLKQERDRLQIEVMRLRQH
jgi:HEAT repeat protein